MQTRLWQQEMLATTEVQSEPQTTGQKRLKLRPWCNGLGSWSSAENLSRLSAMHPSFAAVDKRFDALVIWMIARCPTALAHQFAPSSTTGELCRLLHPFNEFGETWKPLNLPAFCLVMIYCLLESQKFPILYNMNLRGIV